ncbi:group II intron reverse transcriptase/maturase [Aneurinibacillus migulanus]|uniref:group II intron reverse transcriptase/maturase n=1 Tax=Aneurinibacillus migulanus TaxID=47500 RepID=UPI00209DEE51|nr:group II intron reverse transcriptase/maturase [Aneurinibacillus migulanus]MCP1358490.1 group II intron reverse transcriptase/maturase [Aneurinibacillus migulanus]
MTGIFDELYTQSKNGKVFKKLMNLIISENNIKLAFRMIKTNTGSNTAGVDGITIKEIKEKELQVYIQTVREKLCNFQPAHVRRVLIPKANGDMRPLGIPTMIDRLIQQCIKQILEPICEAKFFNHSYEFRPNRSTKHVISRMISLVNMGKFYYTVDVDIKGFFDNVNHNKLIKQIYSLGIQDRKLLSIIKVMLKAPIKGEGIPTKGTPQGGILSLLLANIVLNEFDWWVASQWEHFKSHREYASVDSQRNQLRKTKLKQIYLVRYADDFKIMCKDYYTAKRTLHAVKDWLKTRLKLEISKEKSKIINLKKNYSDFLGISIKAIEKGKTFGGYVAQSHIRPKAQERIKQTLRGQIKLISKESNSNHVTRLNSMILGWHEYYSCATRANLDLVKIAFSVRKLMNQKFRNIGSFRIPTDAEKSPIYLKFHGASKRKTWIINKVPIHPMGYVKHKPVMNFSQEVCDYTIEGRAKATKALESKTSWMIIELAKRYNPNETVEYNDNRISRSSMCTMQCEITGLYLDFDTMHCHHVIPRELGETDEYDNLRIVHEHVHKLIHATTPETINKYISLITNKKSLKKLNTLRSYCNLEKIVI